MCFSTLAFSVFLYLERLCLPVRAAFTQNNRTPANCCQCPQAPGKRENEEKVFSVRNINGTGEQSKSERERSKKKRSRLFLQKNINEKWE